MKVLYGPRGCGKTTILADFAFRMVRRGFPESRILVITFDDPAVPRDAQTVYEGIISRMEGQEETLLILDEATSSIDTRTEMLVQQAFEKLMQGRTSFVVAHRLSTIQSADRILVMNAGHIIEQGTHAELLAKQGFYANLYNSQFAVE